MRPPPRVLQTAHYHRIFFIPQTKKENHTCFSENHGYNRAELRLRASFGAERIPWDLSPPLSPPYQRHTETEKKEQGKERKSKIEIKKQRRVTPSAARWDHYRTHWWTGPTPHVLDCTHLLRPRRAVPHCTPCTTWSPHDPTDEAPIGPFKSVVMTSAGQLSRKEREDRLLRRTSRTASRIPVLPPMSSTGRPSVYSSIVILLESTLEIFSTCLDIFLPFPSLGTLFFCEK